jgi:hypothetical protein
MRLEFDPGGRTAETFVHVPLPAGSRLSAAIMDGKPVPMSAISVSASGEAAIVAAGSLTHPVSFDFTLTPRGTAR